MDYSWIILLAIFVQFSLIIEAGPKRNLRELLKTPPNDHKANTKHSTEIPAAHSSELSNGSPKEKTKTAIPEKFPQPIESLTPDNLRHGVLSFENFWVYLREGFDKAILTRLRAHKKRMEEKAAAAQTLRRWCHTLFSYERPAAYPPVKHHVLPKYYQRTPQLARQPAKHAHPQFHKKIMNSTASVPC